MKTKQIVIFILLTTFLTTPALAGSLRLIGDGFSYHWVGKTTRDKLNQNQRTLGLEYTTKHYNIQASTMIDSFGCRAYQLVAGWQKPLALAGSFGFEIEGLATYRCKRRGTNTTNWVSDYSPHSEQDSWDYVGQHLKGRDIASWQWQQVSNGQIDWQASYYSLAGNGPRGLVFGVLPGFYLNVWRFRFDIGLIYSPWSHRLITYCQVSFTFAKF